MTGQRTSRLFVFEFCVHVACLSRRGSVSALALALACAFGSDAHPPSPLERLWISVFACACSAFAVLRPFSAFKLQASWHMFEFRFRCAHRVRT
ncbi:hypothetical protein DENSPDRAFT_695147 [Dentipellis sp. KUC8613]|nr:hypothetical protein DENSPDRAFT_695147 [Dentipellis sp. KUC8613]